MTFDHNHFYGRHWESEVQQLETQLRLRQSQASKEPDQELEEAELDDGERRAAMMRERLRRWFKR